MNRAAVAAFARVVEYASRGERKALVRQLEVALCFWRMKKSRLPRWFRKGATVLDTTWRPGHVSEVTYLAYDRRIMEHRFTIVERVGPNTSYTTSGMISGYEPRFPFRRAPRASS